MALIDRFIRERHHDIPLNGTFRLTEMGKEKISQGLGEDNRTRLLWALEANGTSDIGELARNSDMRRGQIERMLPSLIRAGYVQSMTPGMGGEE